ncbi:phosphatase PAP2 family protein [Actinoplanes sp. L3-i22]|uniref:phosphatase PAP2 family protein n=1 Tax=Actinoplanes sp. L3-i22 TaxID=2836373 RepID=UPI001C789438|nr:phosphatase PAP2 family protein [Actinoplanes sp. L3-i22]BCY13992.1 hypothetical protein L3i22_090800 [Actinoplanes sp. L3-i22]
MSDPKNQDNRVVERAGWAPVRHFAGRSVLGLIAVIAVGLGFAALLLLVRFHWTPLQDLDHAVAEGLNHQVAGSATKVKILQQISTFGGRVFMTSLVAVVVTMLLIRRRPRLALYLVITGVGAMILDPSLKTLVGRVRPVLESPVAHAPGNSFPSGHALGSMIVYGMLALVLLPGVRNRWRPLFLGFFALIVVLIGFSRIALGVHFLSDVLAGWLLGIAWISTTAYAFRVWRREAGHSAEHVLHDGLEPEAAHDLELTPAEQAVLPHPWVKGAELLVGWVLTFGLLYGLGWTVTNWNPSWDDGFCRWLQTFRTPGLDQASWVWSKAGDTHAILMISLVFCPLALALWRQWRPVLFLVLAMVGELTLFLTSAAAVGRPRPGVEQLDGQMPTSSFPSGHIAATICLWVTIAIIVTARLRQPWRWIFPVLAVVMPLGVATSRMYRGMHHPTDVLGACLLAAAWLTTLWFVVRPNAHAVTAKEAAVENRQLVDA